MNLLRFASDTDISSPPGRTHCRGTYRSVKLGRRKKKKKKFLAQDQKGGEGSGRWLEGSRGERERGLEPCVVGAFSQEKRKWGARISLTRGRGGSYSSRSRSEPQESRAFTWGGNQRAQECPPGSNPTHCQLPQTPPGRPPRLPCRHPAGPHDLAGCLG